ncbi:MAG: hypothetical protein ACFCVE_12560 [Phycisphaerae bacterium]
MPEMKVLSLIKESHQYCLRYEVGQERMVLQSLANMVGRRESDFDWFDAAVMSHQLGRHLSKELAAHMPKKVA